MEEIEADSRLREYWLIVNACMEMGIPASSRLTTFGPMHGKSNSIYFQFPIEMSCEEQPVYFKELQRKLESCFTLNLIKSSGLLIGYTIVGNEVNYYELVELYKKQKPQEKLKEELKGDFSIYTPLTSLNEEGCVSLKAIKRKLNQCSGLTFGRLTISNKEYIWVGENFDKYEAALKFQKTVQISPAGIIETAVIEFEEKYYIAFSKINLKELESLSIKIPTVKEPEITSIKESILPAKQSAIPAKQSTVPTKQTLSPQEKNDKNEKSDCTLS